MARPLMELILLVIAVIFWGLRKFGVPVRRPGR